MSNPYDPRFGIPQPNVPPPPVPPAGAVPPQPPQPIVGQPQPVPVQPVAVQPVPVQPVPVQAVPNAPVPAQPVAVPQVPAQPQYAQPVPVPQPLPAQPQTPPVPVPQQPQPVPVPQQHVQPQIPQQPAPVSNQPVPVQPAPASVPVPATSHPTIQSAANPRLPVPTNAPVPVSSNAPVPLQAASAGPIRTDAEPSEEGEEEATPEVVKKAPPWLVSLVVHMAALIIMALIAIANIEDNTVTLEATYSEEIGEQLIDDVMDMAVMDEAVETDPILSEDFTTVEDPLAAPPELTMITIDSVTASSDIAAPSIGMALSGREKGAKEALLLAYGGTATTEAAVEAGLQWLKRNQRTDGFWSLAGPYDGGVNGENRTAATAMALLAFQGAGHTHRSGKYKDQVKNGWKALLTLQDKDGNFFVEGGLNHRYYAHCQAAIAICELYGMTKDSKYQAPAQAAIDYLEKTQSAEGGWKYAPNSKADTSVTGWAVIALQSAMMAGLKVKSPTLENISKFLDSVTDDGIYYAYEDGRQPSTVMTAEALLCRQYLGWEHNDPRLRVGVEHVNQNPIDWTEQDVYYWYYAAQLTHHMEGDYWNKWNNVMRVEIPRQQVKQGPEAGSWSPHNDEWGHLGGRLYTTSLCIYMLEVYYRHLPIYSYRMKK